MSLINLPMGHIPFVRDLLLLKDQLLSLDLNVFKVAQVPLFFQLFRKLRKASELNQDSLIIGEFLMFFTEWQAKLLLWTWDTKLVYLTLGKISLRYFSFWALTLELLAEKTYLKKLLLSTKYAILHKLLIIEFK